MNKEQFENRIRYSEASGTIAAVDQNVKISLNDYGEYEETIVGVGKEPSSLIEKVSPSFWTDGDETQVAEGLYGGLQEVQYDERLGYYLKLYAGHVVEGDFRKHASSGGMGTWILAELLKCGLVDGVIHVKKNDDPNCAVLFKYSISRSIDEVMQGAKTRYYPVELSGVIETIKNGSGKYAVIGIPSFVMSLRLLAKQDPLVGSRLAFFVGLICGHQKSSKFADAMAWQVGIKPGMLTDIDFRKKIDGSRSSDYGVELTGFVDGKKYTVVKKARELMGQNWGMGFFKSFASDYTDDVFNETADITLGDAWLSDYVNDSRGNNVVIVRDQVVSNLIQKAIGDGRLKMDDIDAETIFKSQASHYRHTHDELAYRLYKKDREGSWRPKKRVAASPRLSCTRKRIQDLREIVAQESHSAFRAAVERDDYEYFSNRMNRVCLKYRRAYRIQYYSEIGVLGCVKYFTMKVVRFLKGIIKKGLRR